jgi:hypothetical protein
MKGSWIYLLAVIWGGFLYSADNESPISNSTAGLNNLIPDLKKAEEEYSYPALDLYSLEEPVALDLFRDPFSWNKGKVLPLLVDSRHWSGNLSSLDGVSNFAFVEFNKEKDGIMIYCENEVIISRKLSLSGMANRIDLRGWFMQESKANSTDPESSEQEGVSIRVYYQSEEEGYKKLLMESPILKGLQWNQLRLSREKIPDGVNEITIELRLPKEGFGNIVFSDLCLGVWNADGEALEVLSPVDNMVNDILGDVLNEVGL